MPVGSQKSAVGVIWDVPGFGIVLATGTAIPVDGELGYATGAVFIVINGAAGTIIYENVGTKASANFDVLVGAGGTFLPLAGGTLDDAADIALNATTGTKIGTAASQKLGFLGATPVIQQLKISDPSGGATIDAEARTAINAIIDVLEAFGLSATV